MRLYIPHYGFYRKNREDLQKGGAAVAVKASFTLASTYLLSQQ
jgi:hypothetical protein